MTKLDTSVSIQFSVSNSGLAKQGNSCVCKVELRRAILEGEKGSNEGPTPTAADIDDTKRHLWPWISIYSSELTLHTSE